VITAGNAVPSLVCGAVSDDKTSRVTTRNSSNAALGFAPAICAGAIFFASCTWASYARWANFEYRSFDLAFYVQGLWQLMGGRFDVSVLGTSLLGNHVEPIVFLVAPLFFLFQHEMVLVFSQNAALATMGPLAFCIGRQLRLSPGTSFFLALALLLTPATGYIALHEFHPEALAAPSLLIMIWGRLGNSRRVHWLGIVTLLACKENMALLVVAYSAVHLFLERKRPWTELRSWYLWPGLVAIAWFTVCATVITPTLNSGAVDYLALYDRLGASPGEILQKVISDPQRITDAVVQSLRQGNLFWGLLLPFLGLSLLRPRWVLIGTPILLQHLLSWRSSEWQIYFHYAAPLVPLFWIALAEGLAAIQQVRRVPAYATVSLPPLVVVACVGAQILLGPAGAIGMSVIEWRAKSPERERKAAFLEQIPPHASVVAPLPYLSHLAMREKLYSLHFILKGLKTLSRSSYDPPEPTDFVLIDYGDSATFNPEAGYYHPPMRTVDGSVIPSSDHLLHDFLKRATWISTSSNELTLFRQGKPEAPTLNSPYASAIEIDARTTLQQIEKTRDVLAAPGAEIVMTWTFQEPREFFPWMRLRLTPTNGGSPIIITRGLCSPESETGTHLEKWRLVRSSRLTPGAYTAEAIFVDHAKALWKKRNYDLPPVNSVRVALGQIKVE
jgi:uncharacterized membrane protein